MKSIKLFSLLVLITILVPFSLSGQNYNNLVNYHINGTPVNGTKIKTNIPFKDGVTMPTVKIEGYDYSKKMPIDLTLVFYIYNNGFTYCGVSNSGGSIPEIFLSHENGKVVIFLNEKVSYQRFTVSAYSKGHKDDAPYYTGWSVADEALTNTYQFKVPYKNNFGGNVGIGTENPTVALEVAGTVKARKIQIDIASGADFVFAPDYELRPLSEVESFINENKHLRDIQSEKDMQENGLSVNDFQIKLLQKIEELTLYIIDQNKRIEHLEEQLQSK